VTDVERIRAELADMAEARRALNEAGQVLMRRIRIAAYAGIEAGLSAREVAELGGVGERTVEGWWAEYRAEHRPAAYVSEKRHDVPAETFPAPAGEAGPDRRRTVNDDRVLAAVVGFGGTCRQAEIVAGTGLNKGTVSRAVARLLDDGRLSRTGDGRLSVAAS
jgi:hypothetical protein